MAWWDRPLPTWDPSKFSFDPSPGAPTTQGNVTYSPVGGQEKLLDMLFSGAVTGRDEGGPLGRQLYSLGLGILPKPMSEMITSQTNEQFGKLGARFGTDLATAISRGLGQAGAMQSLQALDRILGLGGTTAGFQFQRGESGVNRALQEFLAQQQQDPLADLLPLLLGGGF